MTGSNLHRTFGQDEEGSKQVRKPRICMPTSRKFARKAFQCGLYEAQDVLVEIDGVDLIGLEPDQGFQFKERWQRRLLYRDVSKRLIFRNPGLHKVPFTREYDLFVAVCQNYWDLLYINALDGWKDHCKTSVCWIDEMWASELPRYKYWLHALNRFDHIFVGCRGTCAPLSKVLNRTCHWLPSGVDTLRFSPYPNPAERVIDVYSIGRRWEGIHEVFLQAAGRGEIFYVHDTFPVADINVYDHRQHRELFANLAKRSRYFMVAPGKMNASGQTQGQVEIGYRYYEGAAAGAVMIGQPPDSEAFREMFSWPNAVIPIQPDGSDVMAVLASLGSEPAQVSAMSRRNAAEALLRHDWVYRWKEIFRVAGIEPSPDTAARERRLRDLADLATSRIESGTITERVP
jgi:hypothetical protein